MSVSELLLRKNNNLDLIRIVLAILVIIGHAQFLNGPDSFFPDPLQSLFYYTYSGAIAVKLFFFISGLVVTNSLLHKKSIGIFLISRTLRLLPALILVVLVTAFVFGPVLTNVSMGDYFSKELYHYIADNLHFNTQFTLPGVFPNNNYPNTVNGSLWSLRYEVGCYLFMLGIFIPMRFIKNKYFYNIPVLIIIICTFFPRGFMQDLMESTDPERWLLPACFAFGAFCAINAEKIKINAYTILPLIVLYLIYRNSIYRELIMIFAFSIVILFLCSRRFMLKLKPKYDISYGIYLWGFLIQQTLFYYFGHINIILHIITAIVISVILALLTYVSVEKPGMELGKKLSEAFLKYKNKAKLSINYIGLKPGKKLSEVSLQYKIKTKLSINYGGLAISELLLRKNNNLDLIRIVLAMLVIIGHAQFLNGPDPFFSDPLQSLFYYTYSTAIAVKLFFFISGLVVANSLLHKRNVGVFLISRIFRLMPALLLVLVVTALVFGPVLTNVAMHDYFSQETYRYIGWNLYFKTRFSLPGVFTGNLYASVVNGSLWSLRYGAGCYLAMLGIFILTMRIRRKFLYNILVLAIIACTFFPPGFVQSILGTDPERYLLPACFAFGVFCAVNAEKIKLNAITLLLFPVIYMVCMETVYRELVMIYALGIGILYLCSRRFMLKLKPKYDISYGIYLWGFLIAQTLYYYCGHINIILHIIIVIAISVVLAFLTHIGVEKPGMEMGKRLSQSFVGFSRNYKRKWKLSSQ